MLISFEAQGCNMSLKVHFLHSDVNYFPENLGAYSENQVERFHKDLITIEKCNQERLHVHIIAYYYWGLKKETSNAGNRKRNRKSIKVKKHFLLHNMINKDFAIIVLLFII